MAPFTIVVAEPYSAEAMAKLKTVAQLTQLPACDEQSLIDAMHHCDALLVRTASQVTRRVIEAGDQLKVIGRGGVGLDNIDLQAASDHGIPVVYTPHAATQAVADLTFALILGLVWNVRDNDRAVRQGHFQKARELASPKELGGLTLGIIGMGRIGRAVGQRAVNGFLMEVHYNDIMHPDPPLNFAAIAMEKQEVFATSDIVSLHVPLTPATRGMIDARALQGFKRGAILVNTSRGAVVHLDDVHRSLEAGHLGGAGMDVFDPEPVPPNHPISNHPRTLLTPHIGAKSAYAQQEMNGVVDDVIRVLHGQKANYEATTP